MCARHTGRRTSRETSVSVHLDGVTIMSSAKPYGSTCSRSERLDQARGHLGLRKGTNLRDLEP